MDHISATFDHLVLYALSLPPLEINERETSLCAKLNN